MDDRERGFTLIEVMILAAVVLPILLATVGTSSVVGTSLVANSRSAEVTTLARRTMHRISRFARPGKMSTIEVRAVAADVAAGRATSVGEWISPTDLVWRPGIRFRSATGLLSMNAALATSPRQLDFRLEKGEIDNGSDDDGDGLVDEGSLTLSEDDVDIALIGDLEECAFALDGRLLMIRLRVARRDSARRTYRAHVEQHYYLRNN